MSKLLALVKTPPRLTRAAMEQDAPYKATVRGARADVPFDQARSRAAAIWPNLAPIEWLEEIVKERSIDETRKAFENLSETRKAIVMNGHLIKNNRKHRLTFDDAMYRSRFVVKPALKSPHEFPVTPSANLSRQVTA